MAKSNAKKERFKTVAGRRVQKVLDEMENLSKCSNKGSYEYTDEEVKKMMRAIREKVKFLDVAFNSGTKSSKQTFEF